MPVADGRDAQYPVVHREAELEEIRKWAASTKSDNIWGSYLGWLGILRYRQHEFEDAAQLHKEAAALKTHIIARTTCLFNVTAAYENALVLEDALHYSNLTIESARRCERLSHELLATVLHENIRYRMGENAAPDPEIFELTEQLNDKSAGQAHLLLAAAIHARRGEHAQALTYAQRSLALANNASKAVLVLSHTLHCALTGQPPTEATPLFKEILALPQPRVKAQALGLLAMCMKLPEDALTLLSSLRDSVPAAHLHTRLEVLSIGEALIHAGLLEGERAF
jgi:tetratricopeptide (TPR) repeat protein